MSHFITLENVIPELFHSPFPNPLNWQINESEVWTVFGPNGSGKSLLADIICRNFNLLGGKTDYHFRKSKVKDIEEYIKIIKFDNVLSMADYRDAYYQLRYNNPEEEAAPFVSVFFAEKNLNSEEFKRVFDLLEIHKLLDRRLIQLSSGELRKLLIAKILLEKPRMLIFDNPFIGLDAISREHLNELFPKLITHGIQIIFLIPSGSEIPNSTTHILEMKQGEIITKSVIAKFTPTPVFSKKDTKIEWNKLPSQPKSDVEVVIKMENITVAYGDKVICKDINWTVKKGDKWALLGPNGSGKSTLLSYICADNPKSYVEGLTLFENKRGSGESIWDIKQRIGFTSSELHLYYRKKTTCIQVVESGLYDSVGLYHSTFGEERQVAEYLMKVLTINHLKNKLFLEISSGEQKMILFARAIIKNPELLVLDEPFHGLDAENKELCSKILDMYCSQPGKTLIFVTHQKEEIPGCVDRFFELK